MRFLALVLVLALGLSGCAPAPRYPASVAAGLQRRVMAVAKECADGNFSEALTKLADLQSAAASAQADGTIDPGRHARIVTAIDLVRQDLQGEISAAERSALDGALSSLKVAQQKLAEQQKQAEQKQAELEKKAKEANERTEPAQPAPEQPAVPAPEQPGVTAPAEKSPAKGGKPPKADEPGKADHPATGDKPGKADQPGKGDKPGKGKH